MPQPERRLRWQALGVADGAPALSVILGQSAVAGHPDRAARILDDGVDIAVGEAIGLGEQSCPAIGEPGHAADRAKAHPQTVVARRQDGRHPVIR